MQHSLWKRFSSGIADLRALSITDSSRVKENDGEEKTEGDGRGTGKSEFAYNAQK